MRLVRRSGNSIGPLGLGLGLGRSSLSRAIRTAASSLGLECARIYRLVRDFRSDPVTTSLLPRRPGPSEGLASSRPRGGGESRDGAWCDLPEARAAHREAAVRPGPSGLCDRRAQAAAGPAECGWPRPGGHAGCAASGSQTGPSILLGRRRDCPKSSTWITAPSSIRAPSSAVPSSMASGIDYRPPATPRFGGHIERLMGTLMRRVHALPGTTFSGIAARGDYASEARAVLTFREFERMLALEVLGPYHNEVHAALGRRPLLGVERGHRRARPAASRGSGGLLLDSCPTRSVRCAGTGCGCSTCCTRMAGAGPPCGGRRSQGARQV